MSTRGEAPDGVGGSGADAGRNDPGTMRPLVGDRIPAGGDPEPVLDVRDLGVRYDLRLTTRTTLKSSLVGAIGRLRGAQTNHFWALRHVDLQVGHGESLGVIGPNGAGKSTLLLALAGILEPSEGTVAARGRISTLLTLGAGFEMDLTGRENIDLVAAFLDIDQREMAEVTPAIIEFADIGAFVDAPVKTYSTGMRARLGFSIATAIAPDILLLDEVLGTGDHIFRQRSQRRIHELMSQAKAVVIVTHDLDAIAEYCTRAMLIEQGAVIHQGLPDETAAVYRERAEQRRLLGEAEAQRFERRPARSPGA